MSEHRPCRGVDCYCLDPSVLPEGVARDVGCGAINYLFELSYASYLVLPRVLMENMPPEWQARFVQMVGEIEDRFGSYPEEGHYMVYLKNDKGRFMRDPLCDYRHVRLEPKDQPA
jgi:hypothetical protein